MSVAEIHRELCAIYGPNVMSGGTVSQWCKMFKVEPSVASHDLVQSVDQIICETRRFTISELSCQFLLISSIVLYDMIAVRLGQRWPT
jgi:hypothetical protein